MRIINDYAFHLRKIMNCNLENFIEYYDPEELVDMEDGEEDEYTSLTYIDEEEE